MQESIADGKAADVLGYVEGTIVGVLSFVGRTIRTTGAFCFTPDRLWDNVRLGEPKRTLGSARYTGPLTFLAIGLTCVIGAFSLLLKLETWSSEIFGNPFIDLFLTGLKDLNEKKLLLALLPALLIVGLYAWAIDKAARRGTSLGFRRSLALAAFCAGNLCFVNAAAIPLMPLVEFPIRSVTAMSAWAWAISLLSWGGMLKCVHSYMHLLRRELRASRRSTVVVWLGGTGLCLAILYSIMAWMAPLMLALLDR